MSGTLCWWYRCAFLLVPEGHKCRSCSSSRSRLLESKISVQRRCEWTMDAKQCCEMIPHCLWNSCVHGKGGGMYRAHASLCLSRQSCNKGIEDFRHVFSVCNNQISKQCEPETTIRLSTSTYLRQTSGLNPDEIFASVHHSMLDVYCELLEAHALVHAPGILAGASSRAAQRFGY